MDCRLHLTTILIIFSSVCNSEIYKWIGEDGQTNFSDKLNHDIDQEIISLKTTEPNRHRFDVKVETRGITLSEEENKNIIDGANNVYEIFDQVLFFDIYKKIPVNILILKNRLEYRKHLINIGKSNAISSYGVYFPMENKIVVYMREDRDNTFKTIRHEISHAIVDTIMPYAPAWLNEGLAEQMETLNRKRSGLYLESHPYNRQRVSEVSKNGDLTAIDEFLKLPSKDWRHSLDDRKKGLQSQAGQFVYFLFSTPPNRNFIVRMIHKFERGDRTLSYHLVNDAYTGGVKSMEVTWNRWVSQQSNEAIEFF